MDRVECERKLKEYEDNIDKFILDYFKDELYWYQKLILRMMLKKDRYINGLKRRFWV